MMWSFLNPIFLAALGAALIPLILHLMQRHRVVTVPFSAIRFLKLAQKRCSNRIRLENFLLWLLRTLMIVLIALAFALPILRTTSIKQIIGKARGDVAIVWDVSYSMGYTSGKKAAWDAAKDTIVSIIEGLQHGDRVCIFLADDDITPLIEQPTPDLEMALAQVKALEARTTSSQLNRGALAACNALKQSGPGEQEVFIITDGQSLPWEEFRTAQHAASTGPQEAAQPGSADPTTGGTTAGTFRWSSKVADKQTAFFVVVLGALAPENSAPINIKIQPAFMIADSPSQLSVSLDHTGPAQSISVALIIDNQETSRRSVVVDEKAITEMVFPMPGLQAGTHTAKVETSTDGLAIDNSFYFLLHVREKLPVLCMGTDADAFYLARALNPGKHLSAIEVQCAAPDALGANMDASAYSCVFLCNAIPFPGQALVALERYVQRGGLLVLFPGDRATPADYKSWTCLPALPQAISDIRSDNRQVLRLTKPGDPMFTGMHLPPGVTPIVTMNREIQWGPLEAMSDFVITADNNRPFLLRRTVGQGRVLCFSVSADRRWSDFPLSPFFLPIVHQIVQFAAGMGTQNLFMWTSRNLNISDLLPLHQGTVELLDPSGELVTIQELKSGSEVTMYADRISIPGIYYLRQSEGPGTEPLMAANVVRNESDLTRINLQEIPKLLGVRKLNIAENKEDMLRQIKEHRIGRPLAEYLLWLAFLIGIIEFFIANRASRKTSGLSEQLVIESSGRVHGKAIAEAVAR